jgi:TatD DNase family protein
LFKKIPIERLLLETDSPYLAPEPVRGTRNEPKNVKILAEFQARLLGLPTEAFIAETYKNAQCLFSGI